MNTVYIITNKQTNTDCVSLIFIKYKCKLQIQVKYGTTVKTFTKAFKLFSFTTHKLDGYLAVAYILIQKCMNFGEIGEFTYF